MSRVLVVGASARAACASLRDAGFQPLAIDLFADEDCAELAETRRADAGRYPDSLAELAETLEPLPWLYVGGLENRPDVIARISARHELLGNGPEVLRLVRDRAWLAARVAEVPGAAMAPSLARDEPTPSAGRWLWKPPNRAGGSGVRASPPGEVGGHREAFVDGTVLGAIYVTSRATGATQFCGVSAAFPEPALLHAGPFQYSGGTAPAEIDDATETTLRLLGESLGRAGSLVGAWNLDCLIGLRRDSVFDLPPLPRNGGEGASQHSPPAGLSITVLELNPRLTASVDLLLAGFAGLHVAACRGADVRGVPRLTARAMKAVYYAPGSLTYPHAASETRDGVRVADRPAPGTRFEPGQPVLTLLAGGDDPRPLWRRVAELDRLFAPREADS